MRRVTVGAILAVIAASLAALALDIRQVERRLSEGRRHQVVEVSETLTELQRRLEMLDILLDGGGPGRQGAAADYLAARREDFAPVRWLGVISPYDPRPQVLIDSAQSRGFDPAHDAALAPLLERLPRRPLTAARPATYGNVGRLALVLASDARAETLVALVDADQMLERALHTVPKPRASLVLSLDGVAIGQWPVGEPPEAEDWPRQRLELGTVEFGLGLAPPELGWRLSGLSPAPFIFLAAGLATVLALSRRYPAPPKPALSVAAPADAPVARLWQLGELAASLSHDLGQPLNVIRLMAEGTLDGLAAGRAAPERVRRALENTVDQVHRAQSMLDDLVEASRRPKVPAGALWPVEAVRAALARLLPRFRDEGVRLSWHADLDSPMVSGHGHRLGAALNHLLVNACEALAAAAMAGGTDRALAVECRRTAAGVRIVIADNGPGMPPSVRAAMADPLARSRPGGKGCGLGLAVVLGVVAEMGGTVAVDDSAPGTRIAIDLPAARLSLLLAEDDNAAAATLADLLAAHGWEVRPAHGGNAALRLFDQRPADLVLTDLHMGDGDGWSLIEALRQKAPDLPIIAMSTEPEARRAVAAGATIVLRKPLSLGALLDAMHSINR